MSANASAKSPGLGARILILRVARAGRRLDAVVSLIVSTWCPSALTVDDLWPGLVYHQTMKEGLVFVTASLRVSNHNSVQRVLRERRRWHVAEVTGLGNLRHIDCQVCGRINRAYGVRPIRLGARISPFIWLFWRIGTPAHT
jgi:hypothetical protein